jgi:hypothetical protein
MTYVKQLWVDRNPTYPVSAARMLHIEDGIEDLDLGKVTKGSIVLNVADYPSAVAAVAAAPAGSTVFFPTGTYVNPVGIGNGITLPADNITLLFSPGCEIHVPTWGQAGIDAFNRSGIVVRGNPTIRYIGVRGDHLAASYRGSGGYVNTAGFYTNRDRCDVEITTVGMVCGVFFSSFNGVSAVDRVGVDNIITSLHCTDYNFGVLWVGQDGLHLKSLVGRGDLDDSGGVNPTHLYYASSTVAFRAKNITIDSALCIDNNAGQAFQLKFCDNVRLGPHIAQNCAGLLNIIDCTDVTAMEMTGTAITASLTAPHGAITVQGTDSRRLKITATVVMTTLVGVDQRAIMFITNDSVLDITLVSNRASNGAAGTPEAVFSGLNNDITIDIKNISAFPAVMVGIGNGVNASTGNRINIRRFVGGLRAIDWYGPAGGTVHFWRAYMGVSSSTIFTTQAGSPSYTVYEDGMLTGTGTPEGVVVARIGSSYKRFDGGANTSLYVKESGTGNTGWVAK